ncbi:MAG: hypothetical protein ACYTGL_05675 [Planctomycetota bacterium]|jgi:hypothetical protein
MGGNERRMVRKPATKFGNLQKKLGKTKTGQSQPQKPAKPKGR